MRLSFEFSNILGAVYHRGSIKFGPDGSSLFSPVGNRVLIYDLKANKSGALPLQVNCNIQRICIHPKNTIMLASSEKSHLYMVSLTNGKLLHLKEYKAFSTITHISFSPDGRYYCVCGGNLILIYVTPGSLIAGKGREITPFKLIKKLRVNHDTIADVSWSGDSNYVCVASLDGSLNIFDLMDQDRNIVCLRGHTDTILNCYFSNQSSQDRQLYSLTKNCCLFIWDEKVDEEKSEEEKDADGDENPPKRARKSLRYYRSAKHYLKLAAEPEETKQEKNRRSNAYITSSDYNPNARLLVIGYNTGNYSLYEMPNASLIYNLDSDSGSIDSISVNPTGDWIAFGSSVDPEDDLDNAKNRTQSRLLVWEWQSKSHILDQVGSGATKSNLHECVSYSLDGTHIVAGNLAGRIKVWSSLTGETVAYFGEEHKGPIKSIKFAPNKSGKVIVSASLDGTLRAYDLGKFMNFRTFQSPVAEKRPEFICLDIDSTGEFIAAGTYNYFEIYLYSLQTGKFLEYLTGHEGPVSGVAFSPVSNLLVSTSWDNTIRIWNLFEGSKCMRDTITLAHEVITVAFRPDGGQFAASLSNGQIALFDPNTSDQMGAPIEGAGDTLCYSADGSYLIAGGKSNSICIYQEGMLIKKIPIMSAISQVTFSPTMRSFAAATTEGVLVYSLDVSRNFDPYKLVIGVDPSSIQEALKCRRFGLALAQCIQLNDKTIFKEVIEKIPLTEIESIIANLELDYVKRVLGLICNSLPQTKHLEYYLLWMKQILYKHGVSLKNEITPTIRCLHQNTHRSFTDIKKNSDYCRYSLEFLTK